MKDSELKSNKLTSNINEGDGQYKINNYIFFGTSLTTFNKNIFSSCTLYFISDILYNRKFYLTTSHTPEPNKLYERKKEYSREYPRYYTKINYVLKKLYEYSVKKYKKVFQVFQQVAIKNKCNIKNFLIAIQLKKPSDKILNYISIHYPKVTLHY